MDSTKERYQLTWPGKKQAIIEANTPITKTLRPKIDKSVDFNKTKNVYIEGDNLEVLKILQESYLNKIKMIYIDPPYNTGNDFIYKDNFSKNKVDELKDSGIIDDYGNRLEKNKIIYGTFHSDWLSMMYPRLKLARNLLKDDGVIFISIDDNEVQNLKSICIEIMGNNNVDSIIWQKMDPKVDRNTNAKIINRYKEIHETIIICYKNKAKTFFNKIMRLPDWKQEQKNQDNDARGNWQSGIISYEENHKNEDKNSEYYFSIKTPSGKQITRHWFYTKKEFELLDKDNRIYYPKEGEGIPRLKTFENEEKDYYIESILRGIGTSSSAKIELENLLGNRDIFSTPKPSKLILELCRTLKDSNEIILDFFSGSATTAQAVMQLNSEDNGNRKFVMVQVPEQIDRKNNKEAYNFCLDNNLETNICSIGQERIKRSAKKIEEETNAKVDYGFRVYEVDSSNMKDIFYQPNEVSQEQMDFFENNIKEDRTSEDLLWQVIIDLGLTLDVSIDEKIIDENRVFFVNDNELIACFDEKIDIGIVNSMCEVKPSKIVLRDSSFKDDSDFTNFEQEVKQLSSETKVMVI